MERSKLHDLSEMLSGEWRALYCFYALIIYSSFVQLNWFMIGYSVYLKAFEVYDSSRSSVKARVCYFCHDCFSIVSQSHSE